MKVNKICNKSEHSRIRSEIYVVMYKITSKKYIIVAKSQ